MDIIKEIRVHTYERCGEHRFEIAEGIALSILDGKIGKMIRGLESMHSCESIENPYFWMKLSITHKEFLRFECILTDRDMQQYVNGKTVDLEIQFKSLRKQLGKEWLDAKEVKYCEEDIKISAFNAFERELSDFCRESFEESKGVLIGRRINLEKQFIVAF